MPLGGFGAVGAIAGEVVWTPTHTVTEPACIAEPCEIPELPVPPGEQAIAIGASTKTKAEVMNKLEIAIATFEVIDIPKQ
jgi:hypothetical protein